MASAVFDLCDEYVSRYAALDPVYGRGRGIAGDFGAVTDYGPDGIAARADLVRDTLTRLDALTASAAAAEATPNGGGWSAADRLAADHLRERLTVERAWHELDEPLRLLRAVLGPLRAISGVVGEGRPAVEDESDWRGTLERLVAVPVMLASWRGALSLGLERGLPAARRQAVETARKADALAGPDGAPGVHAALLAEYGDGPLAGPLARAAGAAHAGYADLARYLRDDYAPRAAERDGVGAQRYAVASRMALGADIDLVGAYHWAWAELHAVEAELAAEAALVTGTGGDVDEAIAMLDGAQFVEGADAYQAWLQERLDEAVDRLHGNQFDIAPPLRTVEARLVTVPGEAGAFYLPPDERLTRPGRTYWAVSGRRRFAVWAEQTTICHEGVPGHHLQLGRVVLAGDGLSRFARSFGVSGHAEGWAVYAERLADELGWFSAPGTRLGTLRIRARQAARVAIDIGLHLDLPVPAPDAARHGPRWTFEVARDVLSTRGRCVPHRLDPEVVRYCGMPGQATAYKLGERAWLAARDEARVRDGAAFDLKRWHAAALDAGPVGLGLLPEALRRQRTPGGPPPAAG